MELDRGRFSQIPHSTPTPILDVIADVAIAILSIVRELLHQPSNRLVRTYGEHRK